ncbi:PREDICTED: histone deacetylase complex subunit SAP30 [Colobus angolensis palliatus]|uniref:histone deacetylase complex subunit SAP30 n=1 Tax=Colobus angolensis palliatus TaxID=336983 RepID=UPI0005F40626|nr:PREDICTED: histone deacetylase complex subunit SAP30 [Colobus angolensis palliatus]
MHARISSSSIPQGAGSGRSSGRLRSRQLQFPWGHASERKGRDGRGRVALAQSPGPEGGGGVAIQLLKSPCDSERGPGSRRRSSLRPGPQHCPLFRGQQRPAGPGRLVFDRAANLVYRVNCRCRSGERRSGQERGDFSGPGQLCCLREDGERCGRAAGNASFSKRIQKSISQKKVKIELDKSVSNRGIALPSCPLVGPQESGKGTDCRRGLPDLAAVRSRGVCVWKQITKSLQLRPPPQHTHNTHAVVPLFFPTLPPASRCLRLSRALSSLFLLLCDRDTKQRGPPDRGPRVVFLQPGSSSGMEAPLFCCPSWCLAPGGANSPGLGESGGPSRPRKILFLSVFRLLRRGIVGCHFRSIPVNEKDTLTYFIYSVKNDKNKSDVKVDSGVH